MTQLTAVHWDVLTESDDDRLRTVALHLEAVADAVGYVPPILPGRAALASEPVERAALEYEFVEAVKRDHGWGTRWNTDSHPDDSVCNALEALDRAALASEPSASPKHSAGHTECLGCAWDVAHGRPDARYLATGGGQP